MQWQFEDSNNNVGKGFAVLGIYLFCVSTSLKDEKVLALLNLTSCKVCYYGLISKFFHGQSTIQQMGGFQLKSLLTLIALPPPKLFANLSPITPDSTTWLYGAEVVPMALRSKLMGLAAA